MSHRRFGRRVAFVPTALLCLVVLLVPAVAAAFEAGGLPWQPEQMPVTWHLNERGSDDFGIAELEALFATSFAAWTEPACTSLTVSYEGLTAMEAELDDTHVMSFVEEGWSLSSMTLGATSSGPLPDPLRRTADIEFNGTDITWVVGGGGSDLTVIDPQSVMTHEIGHFFTLAHTRDDGSATMAAAYLPNLAQRTLAADDRWGICSVYPADAFAQECDPLDDTCPEGSACEARDTFFFCVEDRDPVGAPCNVTTQNCADTCVYTAADLSEGFCTRVCSSDQDCPESACIPFGGTQVCGVPPPVPMDDDDLDADVGGDSLDAVDAPDAAEMVLESAPDVGAADTGVADVPSTDIVARDDAVADATPPETNADSDSGCACRASGGTHSEAPLAVLLACLLGALAVCRRLAPEERGARR